jgi:iron complex outermembrane receptor protein
MATQAFAIALFCGVDDALQGVRKHPQAKLYPGELVTLALLFVLKGVGTRAVFGEPVSGLRLLGGATLIDAELKETAGGENDGNDAVGVPDYQLNAGAEWDLPFLAQATVSGRVLHTAFHYLNPENTLEIPSWTRLDLGARLTREIADRPVVFRASIENVTNEDYWASANGGYLTLGGPRTVKLSASVDF